MSRHNKTLFQLIKEEASKQEPSNGSQTMKIPSNCIHFHQEEEEEREKDEADTNGFSSPLKHLGKIVKDRQSCNGWLDLGKKGNELYLYSDQKQQQQHKEAQAEECLHLLRFGHGRPCLQEGGELRLETAARLDMMELRLFHARIERDTALTHVLHLRAALGTAYHGLPTTTIDSYCPTSSHAQIFADPHCFYSIEQSRSSGIHLGFHTEMARRDCGSDHGSDHCTPRTSTMTRTRTRTRTKTTTTTTTSSTTKTSPLFYAAPSFQGATPVV